MNFDNYKFDCPSNVCCEHCCTEHDVGGCCMEYYSVDLSTLTCRELLNVMLERADPALHPRLIEVSLSLFQFDRERLEVLREHRDSLRDLPAPQRERLVATLSFKGATARAILDLPTGAN